MLDFARQYKVRGTKRSRIAIYEKQRIIARLSFVIGITIIIIVIMIIILNAIIRMNLQQTIMITNDADCITLLPASAGGRVRIS